MSFNRPGRDRSEYTDSQVAVHPGGCFLGEELVHCALEESDCLGFTFQSRRQLTNNPKAERCRRRHPDHVGMCTSSMDQMHCSSHSSNCAESSLFVPQVPFCTLQYNHHPERVTPLTLYGRCRPNNGAEGTCVWSSDSCPSSGNTFYPVPVETSTNPIDPLTACTCDKVKTGACVYQGQDYTCAVSASACDRDSVFVTWQDLQQQGHPPCMLCDEFDLNRDVSFGARPRGGNRFARSHSCSAGTKAGMVSVGVAVTVAAMTVGWLACCCRRRRIMGKAKELEDGGNELELESDGVFQS